MNNKIKKDLSKGTKIDNIIISLNKLVIAIVIFIAIYLIGYYVVALIGFATGYNLLIVSSYSLGLVLLLIPSTFFSWLFYRHSKDIFPFVVFSIIIFLVSFIFSKKLFINFIILNIPTRLLIDYGDILYFTMQIFGLAVSFFLIWLYYRYWKRRQID